MIPVELMVLKVAVDWLNYQFQLDVTYQFTEGCKREMCLAATSIAKYKIRIRRNFDRWSYDATINSYHNNYSKKIKVILKIFQTSLNTQWNDLRDTRVKTNIVRGKGNNRKKVIIIMTKKIIETKAKKRKTKKKEKRKVAHAVDRG